MVVIESAITMVIKSFISIFLTILPVVSLVLIARISVLIVLLFMFIVGWLIISAIKILAKPIIPMFASFLLFFFIVALESASASKVLYYLDPDYYIC